MSTNGALSPSSIHSEDEWQRFIPVLTVLQQANIPSIAVDMWIARHPGIPLTRKPVVEDPLYGSYHILFPITFEDGTRWLVKIPINGMRGL
ncbi:hypothetical protein PT974_04921 [Cladobotryum mycophilum]|uniref:Aminoglycoside phosphotransferase domain-containing protein n=1 Tax=Cladobotryum mycophilum TaxID=491253 RepID=A0ABR0SQJ8_9HYPO